MKIVIQIDGKDVPVSAEDARRIYDELDQIFGQKEKEYCPYPVYPYWPYVTVPYWLPSSPPTYSIPSVWSQDLSSGTVTIANGPISTGSTISQ